MSEQIIGEEIRIRGLVQGVGFRPTVWRIANRLKLNGQVWNDAAGVVIRVWGDAHSLDRFSRSIQEECPPLGRIESLQRRSFKDDCGDTGFHIVSSHRGTVRTGIVADAAVCEACQREIGDEDNRRYRYPCTNCTHCGPRLSIIDAIPYDRENTSMRGFQMCPDCQAEYENPADRRFHAQPNACPVCGPQVQILDAEGDEICSEGLDVLQRASQLLEQGRILAIKGIGGFHLACDAANPDAVETLRRRKYRSHKSFALMARDPAVIRRYCRISEIEAEILCSPAAPIVLLQRAAENALPESVAPGQNSLGFMLPYSPLHRMLLEDWERPLVMTSGNLSEEPQCTHNRQAFRQLRGVADAYLLHDREILNRVDDSLVRIMAGKPRVLRRARGYAPAPLGLPPGVESAPPLLALGGELKNSFCLLQEGQAIFSQHMGDLESESVFKDYRQALVLYRRLYDHQPQLLVGDLHPGYTTTRYGREMSAEQNLPFIQVQHHHAHIASVMAENGWPLDAGPVLGIALDGTGYGTDGTLWGGEFLLADYQSFERLGWLLPVPLPGGSQAIRQPWRNTFAHLHTLFGWSHVLTEWGDLEAIRRFDQHPIGMLRQMLERNLNSPLSSSCGRLFDALAGLLDICHEDVSYEGQAAMELEASCLASDVTEGDGYPFSLKPLEGGLVLDPEPMWRAVLSDLRTALPPSVISSRFHLGLADGITALAERLLGAHEVDTVALSGGVMQNRILFEHIESKLTALGVKTISHHQVPANDGGIALGQAVIGAAINFRGVKSCYNLNKGEPVKFIHSLERRSQHDHRVHE